MKCTVQIKNIQSINQIDGAWSDQDYIDLLDKMSFPDAEKLPTEELEEMLFMAMSDFEPAEAAEIVLSYKLSEQLGEGQIKNLSHEMMEDKVAEEYSDIALHHQLFNINQLLYKAYNGQFPNTKASHILCEISFAQKQTTPVSKEIVLKALCNGVNERNIITRLFGDQLEGKVEFKEADSIIWELEILADGTISLITSDYWLNDDDFISEEFDGMIQVFVEEDD